MSPELKPKTATKIIPIKNFKSSVIGRYKLSGRDTVNFQFWKMAAQKNIIGPFVRTVRRAQKLSQGDLAARCGALGWDISENTVTKIETQLRCVSDSDIILLARALRTKVRTLFPKNEAIF